MGGAIGFVVDDVQSYLEVEGRVALVVFVLYVVRQLWVQRCLRAVL